MSDIDGATFSAPEMARLQKKVDDLQKFKDWVHKYMESEKPTNRY